MKKKNARIQIFAWMAIFVSFCFYITIYTVNVVQLVTEDVASTYSTSTYSDICF